MPRPKDHIHLASYDEMGARYYQLDYLDDYRYTYSVQMRILPSHQHLLGQGSKLHLASYRSIADAIVGSVDLHSRSSLEMYSIEHQEAQPHGRAERANHIHAQNPSQPNQNTDDEHHEMPLPLMLLLNDARKD